MTFKEDLEEAFRDCDAEHDQWDILVNKGAEYQADTPYERYLESLGKLPGEINDRQP